MDIQMMTYRALELVNIACFFVQCCKCRIRNISLSLVMLTLLYMVCSKYLVNFVCVFLILLISSNYIFEIFPNLEGINQLFILLLIFFFYRWGSLLVIFQMNKLNSNGNYRCGVTLLFNYVLGTNYINVGSKRGLTTISIFSSLNHMLLHNIMMYTNKYYYVLVAMLHNVIFLYLAIFIQTYYRTLSGRAEYEVLLSSHNTPFNHVNFSITHKRGVLRYKGLNKRSYSKMEGIREELYKKFLDTQIQDLRAFKYIKKVTLKFSGKLRYHPRFAIGRMAYRICKYEGIIGIIQTDRILVLLINAENKVGLIEKIIENGKRGKVLSIEIITDAEEQIKLITNEEYDVKLDMGIYYQYENEIEAEIKAEQLKEIKTGKYVAQVALLYIGHIKLTTWDKVTSYVKKICFHTGAVGIFVDPNLAIFLFDTRRKIVHLRKVLGKYEYVSGGVFIEKTSVAEQTRLVKKYRITADREVVSRFLLDNKGHVV